MKIKTLIVAALSGIALASSTFAATAPSSSANPSNTQMSAEQAKKCAKIMMEFMKKDTHQDTEGQKKLDRAWIEYNKAQGINNPGPDPVSYEGTAKDMMQDAKLNQKMQQELAKHGCPPVSPIH